LHYNIHPETFLSDFQLEYIEKLTSILTKDMCAIILPFAHFHLKMDGSNPIVLS